MLSDIKLIDFLAQQENYAFIVEIENLLPKIKKYFFSKRFNTFVHKCVNPKLWPDYTITTNGDELTIINTQYKDDHYFRFAIYLGLSDFNNWYGIIGDNKLFDKDIKEIIDLNEKLKLNGMAKRYNNWIGWKYFNRNRGDLVGISDSDNELMDFFEDWGESFWGFAQEYKDTIEQINVVISKKI